MESTTITMNEYAKKWERNFDNSYAISLYNCYGLKSLLHLRDDVEIHIADMKHWKIEKRQEWLDAVNAAINEKLTNNQSEHLKSQLKNK